MEKKCCEACEDAFEWDDNVIVVGDDLYHKDCVNLYPTGFVAFIGDDFLGETENEGGQMAYEIIDGLLTDNDEEECAFCSNNYPIAWEDVDGKKVCRECYERESDTGEIY
jgi:hypothetical protein